MKYFLEIIFPIIIAFMIFELPIIMYPKKNKHDFNVPFSIKVSSILESIFAIIFLIVGIIIVLFNKYNIKLIFKLYILLFIMAFSMIDFILSAHLNAGTKIARKYCLILSLLRVPTLIGIAFSVVSLYMLYFERNAKKFYLKAKGSNKGSLI